MTQATEERTPTAPTARAWWRVEDWVVVWVGFAILAAVVGGYKPASFSVKWAHAGEIAGLFSTVSVSGWLLLGTATAFLAGLGVVLMGGSVSRFLAGFPVVFLLALGAQFLAGNALVNAWGIEFVIFALLLGLLVSNTIGTPNWLIPAVRTEFYIKTGLVLMGATIIFGEILRAGALGVLQSVLVVIVVWYFSFWLAKKLRLDDEFATMLSTAVSICGVSAAIAACGAIEGDRGNLAT